tara:strand:+ start:153 stop:1274 length:1122 start_codon:yes stop_codon:yes gene_type:complete
MLKYVTLSLLLLYSCEDKKENEGMILSESCGIDTTFTLDRKDFIVVRSPNCTYTTYGSGLQMIDELGNIIWSQGRTRTSPWSMNTTNDSGYILTFTNYISRSPGPNGKISWSAELPTYQATHFVNDAIQTSDGDYIVVGEIGGEPGPTGHNQKGQAFVLKMSDYGDVQWIKRYGIKNTLPDVFSEVVEADDGGFVIVGNKIEAREFYFYDDFWVMKIDASGDEEWSLEIGQNDRYDKANDVIKLSDGSYIATGWSFIDDGIAAMRLVRISSNGNIIWNKLAGGNGWYDVGMSLAVNNNESVLMVAGMKVPPTGWDHSRIKLWGYNPWNGNQIFVRNNFETEQGRNATDVVAAYDNGFIVTSSTFFKMDSLGRW